jgi:hypothetical protein
MLFRDGERRVLQRKIMREYGIFYFAISKSCFCVRIQKFSRRNCAATGRRHSETAGQAIFVAS